MTYEAALKWKNDHMDIIGTVDKKGFIVSDLFIVPSDASKRDAYLRQYLYTDSKEDAILPYTLEDVQVWSVDLNRLESHNILFYNILAE